VEDKASFLGNNRSNSKSKRADAEPLMSKLPPKFVKPLKFDKKDGEVGQRQLYKACKYRPRESSRQGSERGSFTAIPL